MKEVEFAYLAADHFCVFPKLASGYRIPKHSKYLADKTQDALKWQNDPANRHKRYKVFIVSGPPRHGKQIADSVDVLTLGGWKKHGDLKIGDYVFGVDGKPTKILAVSEKTIANMEIEFRNGTVIKCHENHEWLIFDRKLGSGRWRIKETNWLTRKIKNRSRFLLPHRKCVEFPEVEQTNPARRRIGIKDVRYTDKPELGHCIQIDNEDGLYLAGKELIPTHNSELICRHGPAWILGNYPKKEIIIAAYQANLAEKHSRRARALFEKWGPILWETYPSKTTFAGGDWETDQGGGCKAVGIESGASGYGADVLMIDDYHKDTLSAESKLQRDNVWDWWQSSAIERLHPAGIVVIYAVRWHEDDLVGRLIQHEKEFGNECPFEITHIKFPALAEEDDSLGRKPGEALWPWWKDANILNKIKVGVGPYLWAAEFQGHPRARGGTLFKSEWFRYWTRDSQGNYLCWREGHDEAIIVNKYDLTIHAYIDPALETKTMNDPTGMLAWGYSRKHKIWLLLDRINARIEHTKVLEKIKTFALKNLASSIGIENEKLGKVLVKQSAGNDAVGGRKIAFKEIPTGGVDKYARATTMANYFECERVFLPQGAIWLVEYEDSLLGFPRATHDEDVDCTSMAEHMESKSALEDLLRKRR